jgi:hypothetical protein
LKGSSSGFFTACACAAAAARRSAGRAHTPPAFLCVPAGWPQSRAGRRGAHLHDRFVLLQRVQLPRPHPGVVALLALVAAARRGGRARQAHAGPKPSHTRGCRLSARRTRRAPRRRRPRARPRGYPGHTGRKPARAGARLGAGGAEEHDTQRVALRRRRNILWHLRAARGVRDPPLCAPRTHAVSARRRCGGAASAGSVRNAHHTCAQTRTR